MFHEGLKGWSCCDKRFVDFADFFEFPVRFWLYVVAAYVCASCCRSRC